MRVSARMLAGIAAALVAVCAAPAARAESVAGTLQRWGLLGTWATDCKRPPSPGNSHLSFVKSGQGRVLHQRAYGDGTDSQEVLRATIMPAGQIEVVVDFGRGIGVRRWVMIKGPDGRVRTIANSKVDGTGVTVRDGRFVHNGRELPWQTRCRGGADEREARATCPGAGRNRSGACAGSLA